jgi:O-methyltransferase
MEAADSGAVTAGGSADVAERYLELLKKALTHTLYRPVDVGRFVGRNAIARLVYRQLERRSIIPLRAIDNPEQYRAEGHDCPLFAHTMVGTQRLDQLQECIEDVIAREVPGDLIETGVWRGGSSILMRGALAAHGVTDRTVWVADSFEGLPEPDPESYPADAGVGSSEADRLVVGLDEVRENFRRYGLLDDKVRFLKGWFKDTLKTIPDPTWAVVRLDGDLYESTMDALTALYPNLSSGGYLIVDDYGLEMCRKAVDDYREQHGVSEPIERIDWTGVYWRKEGAPA